QTVYRYESLRTSTYSRGPQGFAKVTAIDQREGSNQAAWRYTETRFAQAYPYTGLPTQVLRTVGGYRLGITGTTYCNTVVEDANGDANCTSGAFPSRTSMWVYPRTIVDDGYLHSDDSPQAIPNNLLRTRSEFRYDDAGNSLKTTVALEAFDGSCDPDADDPGQRCPKHQKTVTNSYDANGGAIPTATPVRLGKPTLTTVTAQSLVPAGAPRTHTTEFRYSSLANGAIALTKKLVEPGSAAAGATTELHTAYAYDEFGNVTNTTECDSAFEDCVPTPYPNQPHPGHRRTEVSYDP